MCYVVKKPYTYTYRIQHNQDNNVVEVSNTFKHTKQMKLLTNMNTIETMNTHLKYNF